MFAELLTSLGNPAQAMTGGQAGIITDDTFGDAHILEVDPRAVLAAIDKGLVPVVTGFQGATRGGGVSTLGRGGSDLTAIALGDALKASSVDIYTDVSGVFTADPRRVADAHSIDRVTPAEMVELAGNGAKVMHSKAAELAHATKTPYAVKGLRSNVGTLIDDDAPVDRDKPVTGITALRNVAFFRVIQGLSDEGGRAMLDRELFNRLAAKNISIDMINVNDAGVFFVCDDENVERVRAELHNLNLALRVRTHCAKLSIVGAGHARHAGRHGRRRARRHGSRRRDHPLDRLEHHDLGARARRRSRQSRTGAARFLRARPAGGGRRMKALGRLLTAMITPFDADGAVDVARSRAHRAVPHRSRQRRRDRQRHHRRSAGARNR